MARAHSTLREHPFERGRTYTAKASFDGFPSCRFVVGQQYIFEDVGWSHYDSCSIFQFKEVGSSGELSWWLPDDHSISECLERFEQVL
jgi:hypothetical protein